MSNIVYLSRDVDAATGGRTGDICDESEVPELLIKLDDCMVKIAVLRDTVMQALDTSRTLLDNLDDTIAAIPDLEQRSALESKRSQARDVVQVNSRSISETLEFMAAFAAKIRDRAYEVVVS